MSSNKVEVIKIRCINEILVKRNHFSNIESKFNNKKQKTIRLWFFVSEIDCLIFLLIIWSKKTNKFKFLPRFEATPVYKIQFIFIDLR